eukprot:m.52003 g.52003  ORF g.52003 m.52003 type:complete len:485 (+) comp13474_c0_seq1:270-1724(+)
MDTHEDDDDPIVAELDVFVSSSLQNQLYMFQYPLRNTQRPVVDEHSYAEVQFKPNAQAVEMKVPLDTTAHNYDAARGEAFAESANLPLTLAPATSSKGRMRTEPDDPVMKPKTFESNTMDYYTLSSTKAPSAKQYAAGFVRNGEVHLTALEGVLQLRPSLNHLDEGDMRAAAADKASKAAERAGDEPPTSTAPASSVVKVQVTKAESAKAAAARKRSYAHMQQQLADEPWIPLTYSHNLSALAQRKRDLLIGQSRLPIVFPLPGHEYLARLHKSDASSLGTSSNKKAHPAMMLTTLAEIKSKPLGEGLRMLLRQAQVLHYKHFSAVVKDGMEHLLLDQLPGLALLVQGCWAARSQLVYPEKSMSYFTGLEAPRLIFARDYVLWRFYHGAPIKRSELMEYGRVPEEDASHMLEQMAVKHSQEFGWILKLQRDQEFMQQHPDVVKRATRDFVDFERTLMRDLNLSHQHKTEVTAIAKRLKAALAAC